MTMRQILLAGAVAMGLAGAGVAPAFADWGDHGHGGGDWHGGGGDWHGDGGWHGGGDWHGGPGGHWDGRPYHDWHDHGWWGAGHIWHWYAGWGPDYGYIGPAPVWEPGVPVYAGPPPGYYYAPPPPPPVYYAPPPPPPVYVAPMPSVIITPRGVGITP
ncbi:hypothetical protein [Acidocella facilis]|uniref:hypothetical protein n=1 Tax=Acidocella facilis TaxID=525 RepID=UPI00054EB25B|nr:hypothetical protein [Acidocella facilis]